MFSKIIINDILFIVGEVNEMVKVIGIYIGFI